MERLGWGGGVGERGSGSLGPCVSKQGRARLTQTGVCLRSEVGGRRETHEGWDRAGRQPARSLAGRWEISPTFGISLKEGRLLRLLISLLAGLTLLLGPEAPGPGPQLQNSLVGSSGLCTFLGFRLPPPRGPPALLSPVPAQVSGARECLTLVDLISNPLTFSSARQAWVPGNVTILFPLPPTPPPTRPRIPVLPKPPTSLAFPLAALGEGRVLPPTLGSRHPPPRTPPQGQPRPLPRILHVAMQTRGCQALGTMLPCEAAGRGPWYGPRPRGCQLGAGPALKGAVGAAGPVVPDTAPSTPSPPTAVLQAGKSQATWIWPSWGRRVPQS